MPRNTAIALGYAPPAGLTRPPHRFSTLLRGTNKKVPDNAPPAPGPDYQSPFDSILHRSLAWQEDAVVRAPQIAVGMSAKVESILREDEVPGYESDGSDDLTTLRSQYAQAFPMMGVKRSSVKQGPRTVPASTHGQQSAALHQTRVPDAPSPDKKATTKTTSQQTLGNQNVEPLVAGWVETGRYGGGEAGDAYAAHGQYVQKDATAPPYTQQVQHTWQNTEGLGAREGDVEDEHQLTIAFKSLQERIHHQMSSNHHQPLISAKHTVLAVPHQAMESPNTHIVHSVQSHPQGTIGGSPAGYAQGRSDPRQEAIEAVTVTDKGSPAGASSLRAGTTRRQIAQVYDHEYDVSGGSTAFQGRGGDGGGGMARAGSGIIGAEGRQQMFGGDAKLWEQSSSVIRQQFASLYSALSQQQHEDLSQQQQRPAAGGKQVRMADPQLDSRGSSDKVSQSSGNAMATRTRRRGGHDAVQGRDDELVASGMARDGITTSMSDLRREIEATAHQYHSNKAVMQARRASRPLRAEQRKAAGRLITQRDKDAREIRQGKDEWEAEAKGKTWAMRLKDMHKLVKDLEPLVDMATSNKTARPGTAPVSAKGQTPAYPVPATRPKTAGGSRQAAAASQGGRPVSADGDGARYGMMEGGGPSHFAKGSGKVEAWSQQPQARFEAWGAGAGWERDLGELDSEMNRQSGGQDADNEADVSLYARDEAIGARPRTRRGRGMLTRDSVAVDDQACNSHQHLMEAVPVADDEMSGANAGGGHSLSQHDSEEEGVFVVPKRDEAIGARPPTRRGRPDPPRRAQEPKSYDGAGADGGDAGREIFSDCTTPDAPDGIDADEGAWKHANGMNGNQGGAEILRLSGSDAGGMIVSNNIGGRGNLDDDDSSDLDSEDNRGGDEVNGAEDGDAGMWQKQEQVLKLMLDRQEHILRRSQELAARGAQATGGNL